MNRFVGLMVALLLLSASAHASTPLLIIGPGDPGAPPPNENPRSFATRVEYQVQPNVRGIAENAVRDRPEAVTLSLPTRNEPMAFKQYKFEPLEGFVIGERGEVMVDPKTPTERLRYNWLGEGLYADVLLTVIGGRATARVVVDNDVYMLVTSEGRSTLRWLDMSKFPEEFEYPPARDDKAWEFPAEPAPRKYIDRVRVLVVHTQAALIKAGNTTVLNDRVEASMTALATSLTNSGIVQTQVELIRPNGVASTWVNYNQSLPALAGNATHRWLAHRAWLRSNAAVKNLRNQHQADLVVMIVQDEGSSGVAYVQRPDCTLDLAAGYGTDAGVPCTGIGAGFAHLGVAVVTFESALADLTFPHEIGHLFGLDHDPGTTPAAVASRVWSFAHSAIVPNPEPELTKGSRSIMSIAGGCPIPNKCPRRMNFSNPNVKFIGFPATASGTLTPDPQGRYRFNARTFALFSPFVSEFRGPVTSADRIFRHDFEALPDVGY